MSWTKDPIHLNVVAGIMIARAVLMAILAAFIMIIFSFVSTFAFEAAMEEGAPEEVLKLVEGLLYFIRFLIFSYAGFNLLGGVLILNKSEAGRIIGIIINFIAVFSFPIGTALGIYSLLVLFDSKLVK